MSRDNYNDVLGIGIFVGVGLLCIFFAALMGSHTAGEVAGALGSFIGGIVGAGGAVLAVFLALSAQRREETAKVSAAVRTEITTLAKYIIGAIEACHTIANGTRQVPVEHASYIVKNLTSEPIVYSAVADRIGLLPHPHATTEFYLRLAEAKTMIESFKGAASYFPTAPKFVTPDFVAVVADSLIATLQLARAIISDGENHSPGASPADIFTITSCRTTACISAWRYSELRFRLS
jgi:hypothetical protein